jgi:hypothetical protein
MFPFKSAMPHACPLCVVFAKGTPLPVNAQFEYPEAVNVTEASFVSASALLLFPFGWYGATSE